MTCFIISFEFFQKFQFTKQSTKLEFRNPGIGGCQIFSKIANPASNYGSSSSYSFRDMTSFMISF